MDFSAEMTGLSTEQCKRRNYAYTDLFHEAGRVTQLFNIRLGSPDMLGNIMDLSIEHEAEKNISAGH